MGTERTGDAVRMRATAQVTSPAALGPGDHLCWSYDSDEAYQQGLARYLAAGVQAGDKLLCFTGAVPVEPVLAELRRLFPGHVDTLVASGRLLFVDARSAYTPDGRFEEQRMLDAFRAQAGAAAGEGYRALRAAGEAAWLLDAVDGDRLAAYEAACDRMAATLPLTGLCTYDTRGRDPDVLARIHAVHAASYGSSAETPSFRVHAHADGSVAVVGEVDVFMLGAFGGALADALTVADRPVLDLSRLAFIDVAALRRFADVLAAQEGPAPVEVHGMRPVTRRCWDLLALAEVAPGVVVA